jgi:hypothetical protein
MKVEMEKMREEGKEKGDEGVQERREEVEKWKAGRTEGKGDVGEERLKKMERIERQRGEEGESKMQIESMVESDKGCGEE